MKLLRFPQRALVDSGAWSVFGDVPSRDAEFPPANLRFLLTPDHDPALDYLDQLSGLDIMDDTEREARIAVARHSAS